jgi:hypothetical protein
MHIPAKCTPGGIKKVKSILLCTNPQTVSVVLKKAGYIAAGYRIFGFAFPVFGKNAGLPIEQVKSGCGSNPQIMFRIFKYRAYIIIADAVGVEIRMDVVLKGIILNI